MNRQIKNLYPAVTIAMLMFTLAVMAGLSIAQEDKQKGASEREAAVSSGGQSETEKAEKEPTTFAATEEVSADQAVSFPTDI